jgi:hypothetical protein
MSAAEMRTSRKKESTYLVDVRRTTLVAAAHRCLLDLKVRVNSSDLVRDQVDRASSSVTEDKYVANLAKSQYPRLFKMTTRGLEMIP